MRSSEYGYNPKKRMLLEGYITRGRSLKRRGVVYAMDPSKYWSFLFIGSGFRCVGICLFPSHDLGIRLLFLLVLRPGQTVGCFLLCCFFLVLDAILVSLVSAGHLDRCWIFFFCLGSFSFVCDYIIIFIYLYILLVPCLRKLLGWG